MAIDDNLTERIVSEFVEHGDGIISYEVERWEKFKGEYEVWRMRIFEKNGHFIGSTYICKVK